MTLDEKYQKISIMINNGTGVLFQPMSNEFTYILTAKHNVQFKNQDNIYVDKNIEDIVLKNNLGIVLNLEIKGMYHHQSLDISIIKINYYEIEYFTNFLTNRESNKIDFNLYGYPNTRRTQDIKDRLFKLEYNNQPNTDLIVMKERDYIAGPKPNGYRSYHIILGIPVYCLDGMEYFPVEIQFRTMSMDFWASMEHRINYKKERQDREKLVKELKEHARKLEKIEKSFEKYSENVQNSLS